MSSKKVDRGGMWCSVVFVLMFTATVGLFFFVLYSLDRQRIRLAELRGKFVIYHPIKNQATSPCLAYREQYTNQLQPGVAFHGGYTTDLMDPAIKPAIWFKSTFGSSAVFRYLSWYPADDNAEYLQLLPPQEDGQSVPVAVNGVISENDLVVYIERVDVAGKIGCIVDTTIE